MSSGTTSERPVIQASRHLSFTIPLKTPRETREQYGLSALDSQTTATARETQIDRDITALRQKGYQLLSGEIPKDVTEAVRKATTSGALARGISRDSPVFRNLVTRDLALTSLDLQQAGAAQLESIAKLQEGRQQFRRQYEMSLANLMELSRERELGIAQQAQARYEFAQRLATVLNEQLLGLAKFREELQYRFMATKLEGSASAASGSLKTLDSLLQQLKSTVIDL